MGDCSNKTLLMFGLFLVLLYMYMNEDPRAVAKESFNTLPARFNAVTSILGQPSLPIAVQYAPSSTHLLPQQGLVVGSPFDIVSNRLKYPTISNNNMILDWRAQDESICSGYNAVIGPRSQQDCPDSSFSYTTDLSRFIPGANHGGCIQLGYSSQPFCYSTPSGNYKPWWEKLEASSP